MGAHDFRFIPYAALPMKRYLSLTLAILLPPDATSSLDSP